MSVKCKRINSKLQNSKTKKYTYINEKKRTPVQYQFKRISYLNLSFCAKGSFSYIISYEYLMPNRNNKKLIVEIASLHGILSFIFEKIQSKMTALLLIFIQTFKLEKNLQSIKLKKGILKPFFKKRFIRHTTMAASIMAYIRDPLKIKL